jgi:hypothetical protein
MVFGDSNSGAKVVSRLVLPWSHGHSPGVAIAVSPLGQGADVLIGKLFLYDVPGLIHFVHMSNVVEFLSHIMFHRADTITIVISFIADSSSFEECLLEHDESQAVLILTGSRELISILVEVSGEALEILSRVGKILHPWRMA